MKVGTTLLGMIVIASCAIGTTSAAMLGTADIKYTGTTPRVNISVTWENPDGGNYHSGTVMVGVYNVESTNAPSWLDLTSPTFCMEAQQTSTGPHPYTIRDLSDGPLPNGPADTNKGPMGQGKADFLRELWGRFIGEVNSNTTAAAFQLAVWEIIYEDLYDSEGDIIADPDWDVFAGKFRATSTGTDATTAKNLANDWLSQLDGTGPMPRLYALTNPNYQDFIAIPEPASLALIGLGGLVLLSRRRGGRA